MSLRQFGGEERQLIFEFVGEQAVNESGIGNEKSKPTL
jgi:hypothetical protein